MRLRFCMLLAITLSMLTASAVAALAGGVGWVWTSCPSCTSSYSPESRYSFNSTGGAITITPAATGVYQVFFDKLENFTGTPDNVEVSAYDSNGRCVSFGWGSSTTYLEAMVACYDASGNLANSQFTLLYQARSKRLGSADRGIAYVLANCAACSSYTADSNVSFNSTGGTNTIVRSSVGSYAVTLPGLYDKHSNVLVTAYQANGGGYCNVEKWTGSATSTTVNVLCFNSAGTAADTEFDLAYAVREPFGLAGSATSKGAWAWANCPTCKGTYTPNLKYQYNGFATGNLTAVANATGDYTVTIPGSTTFHKSVVLATSYGGRNRYCNVTKWDTTASTVACYAPGGAPANSDVDVTMQTED